MADDMQAHDMQKDDLQKDDVQKDEVQANDVQANDLQTNDLQKDWRELCVAVTNETDSTKLGSLVQELIEALDKGEQRWRHGNRSSEASAANLQAA
jgi:hypothetical protein